MKKLTTATLSLFAATLFFSCQNNTGSQANDDKTQTEHSSKDDSLLTEIQRNTFQYFWEGAEPTSGMARERIHLDGIYPKNDQNVVTIGGSGFGLMAIITGIERGFITREEGVKRLAHVMNYLSEIERFQGAWAHWYHGDTKKVQAFSEKDNGGDIVETAFLAQSLITIREYLKNGSEDEQAVASSADELWKGINWNHYTNGQNVIFWHWSPTVDFGMNHPVRGYDEGLITYILAASSPTHAIDTAVYHEGWARSGEIRSTAEKLNIPLSIKHNARPGEIGPLFWAHYSYLGLDPKGLQDRYANYWDVTSNHAKINIAYAQENPKGYKGYGADKGWGLTASYSLKGYDAHHPDNDHGVISPTAALSSMPYTPEESISFAHYLMDSLGTKVWGKYGFYDAYSETEDWFPQHYLAIDQGPIVVMIENYRSGLLWNLFMEAPEIKAGLKKLGFSSPRIR